MTNCQSLPYSYIYSHSHEWHCQWRKRERQCAYHMCMLAHSRVSLPNNTYGWLLAQLSNNTETSKSKRNHSYVYGFFLLCVFFLFCNITFNWVILKNGKHFGVDKMLRNGNYFILFISPIRRQVDSWIEFKISADNSM